MTGKKPNCYTYSTHRGENVDPETGITDGKGNINRFILPQSVQLQGRQKLSGQIIDFLMGPFQLTVKLNTTKLSSYNGMFAGDVNIRHRFFDCSLDNTFKPFHKTLTFTVINLRKTIRSAIKSSDYQHYRKSSASC
jgi:hypothetical protein